MKSVFGFSLIICFIVVFCQPAYSEFSSDNKLNISLGAQGNTDYQTWNLSGTLPLNFINGYLGAEWLRLQSGNHIDNFIRGRIEGGYHIKKIGLRIYSRYGEKSMPEQSHKLHSGIYLHFDLIDKTGLKLNSGLGIWASQKHDIRSKLNFGKDLESGPQVHLGLKLTNFHVLCEYLPSSNFEKYDIRIIPTLDIPLVKPFLSKKMLLQLSCEIIYTNSENINSDNLSWHWKNSFQIKF